MDLTKYTAEQILTTLDANGQALKCIDVCKQVITDELNRGYEWINQKSTNNVKVTVLGIVCVIDRYVTYLLEVPKSHMRFICYIGDLVKLQDAGKIIITNPEFIKDDLKIYYARQDKDSLKQQYEKYKQFVMKCELLDIKYSIVEESDDGYTLTGLVPDENGVATIPDFVTSIDSSDSLLTNRFTKIIWRNPLVFDIRGMFTANDKIVNIDLSEFNLSVIPGLAHTFFNCRNLRSVDFGDNDFHNVATMREMFGDCIDLNGLLIHNAKFNRHCELVGFMNGCRMTTVLDMSNESVYTEKPIGISFYTRGNFLMNRHTGVNNNCTIVNLQATSLAHIISTLPDSDDEHDRNTIYQLNELTGINYIKKLINGYSVSGMKLLEIKNKLVNLEKSCMDTNDYKTALNNNSIVLFVGEEYDINYSRCALIANLPRKWKDKVQELEDLGGGDWVKNYKYRLIIGSYIETKSICIIYFNKYSEWEMEDTEEWKILN